MNRLKMLLLAEIPISRNLRKNPHITPVEEIISNEVNEQSLEPIPCIVYKNKLKCDYNY
jgi:hypothetical protein